MRASELCGAELALWVARAEGLEQPAIEMDECVAGGHAHGYVPHENWAQGGPIAERERISLVAEEGVSFQSELQWKATITAPTEIITYGPTPLIAAMRAFVAHKFGDPIVDE